MAKLTERYARSTLTLEPGNRLHHLVATLFDTHYDDLTEERIDALQTLAESWRWMNADGERV